jgi:hypothetical protein
VSKADAARAYLSALNMLHKREGEGQIQEHERTLFSSKQFGRYGVELPAMNVMIAVL